MSNIKTFFMFLLGFLFGVYGTVTMMIGYKTGEIAGLRPSYTKYTVPTRREYSSYKRRDEDA